MLVREPNYKSQYYLSLIPFVGFLIAFACAWSNIHSITKNILLVALHFLIWIIPAAIGGILIYFGFFYGIGLIANMNLRTALSLLLAYIVLVMYGVAAVAIEKGILSKVFKKQ